MFDCRLPFGGALSCRIFQTISYSIVRMLKSHGFESICYLDDFIIIGKDKTDCEAGLNCLVEIVLGLGLSVNEKKTAKPSQVMTFLGVEIDCVRRTLSLPSDKLLELRTLLTLWKCKRRCTKKDLQRLIGKLNWCARVVRGGRTFIRNLINLMCKLKQSHHYIRMNLAAKSDVDWWCQGLNFFHGTTPFNVDIPVPNSQFATDACLSGGAGHYLNHWFYTSWVTDMPTYANCHINVLELLTVLVAAKRWGHLWQGDHIIVRSDNMATVSAVNHSTSRSPELLSLVKEIFWLSVRFNFRLSAVHIPGKLNVLSDHLSRLHCVQDALTATSMLCPEFNVLVCKGHMSYASYLYLQEAWLTWMH